MRSAKKRAAEVPDPQFVVDREGNRKAVILPLEEYEQLLEDLHDLAVVAERHDEEAVDLAEIKKRLLADCLL
jgi:PHD/YefM family antitoxin component YafN of YafNO toxin-antitoxin module